jgi:prepilin-type N-terminal cleavage/methylation domain-containing protein/prepilin-type processing-associated H-X9-DG protein
MKNGKDGFSLVELLMVISIVSLLLSLVLPALNRARQQSRKIVSASNIHQLALANEGYSYENKGYYVLAAYDIFESYGGKSRWHGVRSSDSVSEDMAQNNFDPKKGPLASYLGDGKVKACPSLVNYVKDGAKNAFEAGCGGYGYNSIGVGSRTYEFGYCDKAMRSSMRNSEIRRPNQKIMFADTASTQGWPNQYMIEYSFCEAPKQVINKKGNVYESGSPSPSTHFRHMGQANAVYCDGHVESNRMASWTGKVLSRSSDLWRKFKLGWFGPEDNSLFRPN